MMKDICDRDLFGPRLLSKIIFVEDNWKKEKCQSWHIYEGFEVGRFWASRGLDQTP